MTGSDLSRSVEIEAGRPSRFPAGFWWGTATASYQIEGAVHEDGRGESIWDRFCATPGKIANGDTGENACDFYHRYPADIELMREAGLNAFRLSIAWPRVLPAGRGAVNKPGLDFYDRLIDALLESDVEPVVTLYHWDLPVALEDAGGWPNRETAYAFAEFAEVVTRRLGDRVTQWITLNEPWCSAWLGYGSGDHAPGRTSVPDAVSAAHHLLLAHGLAVQAIRREVPNAKIGISLNPTHVVAASPEDADAAFAADAHQNRWLLDPLFGRGYPPDLLERFGAGPAILPGDLETIATPIDVLGVNYYHRHVVVADGGGWAIERQPGSEYTAMGWEVWPDGLVDLLQRLHTDYAPPEMWITENGAAYEDVPTADGRVDDPRRLAYLADHLDALGRAVEAGIPVSGYFVWSLLDNFEWARGYAKRFGIVYVDWATLERTPKSSYYWYRDFVARARAASSGR